jgi:hypothetical protein
LRLRAQGGIKYWQTGKGKSWLNFSDEKYMKRSEAAIKSNDLQQT